MLCQIRRVVVGALLALVVFAGPAAAECAWVLWGTLRLTEPAYLIRGAFEKKIECEAAKAEVERDDVLEYARGTQSGKPSPPSNWAYHCLPDTVDPRGSKGGGR